MTAALGWGSYRAGGAVADAVAAVAEEGAGWVDTAPNYGDGTHQRVIGAALAAHPLVRVSTKVGYLSPGVRTAAQAEGVLTPGDTPGGTAWSLAPDYVTWQVERTLVELGRPPDVVFVHNPEHLDQPGRVMAALADAFARLESAASAGLIGGYGVATWRGFTSAFTVPQLIALARAAAGGPEHHLRAVQLPVSLVQITPLAEALEGGGPLVEAREAGLTVFASAPLHGGQLIEIVAGELAELIGHGLTAAQAALAVPLAAPGVDYVLLGTRERAHWREAAEVAAAPRLDGAALRKIVDALDYTAP